jgi:hypothetical protein
MLLTQFQCRLAKKLNNLENKRESKDFSQINRAENCAICDVVAQFKMKWRSLFGAVGTRVSDQQQRPNLPGRQ